VFLLPPRITFTAGCCRSRARFISRSATASRASVWLVPGGNSKTSVSSNGFGNRTGSLAGVDGGRATGAAVRGTVAMARWAGRSGLEDRYTTQPIRTAATATLRARATRGAGNSRFRAAVMARARAVCARGDTGTCAGSRLGFSIARDRDSASKSSALSSNSRGASSLPRLNPSESPSRFSFMPPR